MTIQEHARKAAALQIVGYVDLSGYKYALAVQWSPDTPVQISHIRSEHRLKEKLIDLSTRKGVKFAYAQRTQDKE